MKVPHFIPWISSQDKKAVLNAMGQRWLTNGPILKKFESNFAKFVKVKNAVGVGSATHALHLVARSIGLKQGDEVIAPTFTFAATINSVIYCGAKPILADIDSKNFNILPSEIERKITKRTKAIIMVHYGGQPCDCDKISAIAKKNNLYLIEDCAHSLGAKFRNKFCGSFGIAGCYSFYPTKIITSGEGGMVVTNNNKLFKFIQKLKSQALDISPDEREKKALWKYDIADLGYNYRLDEIRASLGLSQLQRIQKMNDLRSKIAKKYSEKLKNIKGIHVPKVMPNRNHVFHLYTIKIDKDYHLTRDELFSKLSKKGIGTTVQYYPLHLLTYYKKNYDYKISDFPNANKLKDQVISLPIFPKITNRQIDYVCSQIKN